MNPTTLVLPFKGDFRVSQTHGNQLWETLPTGQTIEHYNHYFGYRGHNGIDYALPVGTPLFAPHAGKVLEAMFDPSYGWYVKIENEREGSVIAHMKSLLVSVGMMLKVGDAIGYSGNSGNVRPRPTVAKPNAGAHLHWGYYQIPRNRNNGYNGFIDQTPYLQAQNPTPIVSNPQQPVQPVVNQPVANSPPSKMMHPEKDFEITIEYVLALERDREDFMKRTGQEQEKNKLLQEEYDKYKLETDAMREFFLYCRSQGYDTIDELKKKFEDYDTQIIGLNKELKQVLERNAILAGLVKDKDTEDSTAIDEATQVVTDAKQHRDTLTQIAKFLETKPELATMLREIEIRTAQAKQFKILMDQKIIEKAKNIGVEVTPENIRQAEKIGLNFFERVFNALFVVKKEVN